MRLVSIIALLALIVSVGLGVIAQSAPPAARATDQITPMARSWYASLPRDPAAATAAYLSRVPIVMRERGDAISRSRYWVLAARIAASIGALLIFLYSGAACELDAALTSLIRFLWLRAFAYAFALLTYAFVITLPVEVCASYIRYRAYGFSEQPFASWLQDYAVGWAGTAIFYSAGLAVLAGMVRRWPRGWFLGAGLVYLALAVAYVAAAPTFLEPLTNIYTPLPDSPLKRDILAMAATAGVPADNVYTDDASRQSRRLNGHVSGVFGAARITIDDTAFASAPGQVKALAAHEMGHYVLYHPLKMVAVAALIATLGFAIIAWLQPLLLRRFGGRWRISSFDKTGEIAVLWLLFTAWGFISDPIANAYARRQEAQADAFSLNLAREPLGLADFMLQDADIGRLQPTTVDLFLFYDHPSDASRIRSAMQWRAEHWELNGG